MAIKIFCTKNNLKCIYVKENNDLSHGEKSQGSWCWGMGEEWGWEEEEYLQKERRRGPLYCEQGSRLGIAVKGNVFSFFWLDPTWKKWSWRKLWLAMGKIQNLVKSGPFPPTGYTLGLLGALTTDWVEVSSTHPCRWATSCQGNLGSWPTEKPFAVVFKDKLCKHSIWPLPSVLLIHRSISIYSSSCD